ncbi:MAG: glycosyltransferase [Sphingobacteriia bacterium]|nr:glycosyltransferase [Sphingobacteriia bacterium]
MDVNQYAPVLIPTLNRYEHFKRCIESLAKCNHADKTDLFVSLDYPLKNTHWDGYSKIKQYLSEISGFRTITVIQRERNFGAIGNFHKSISEIYENYDRVIFSEDDNEFSENFLDYINQGLMIFNDFHNIQAICGYNYPIKFSAKGRESNYYFSKAFSAWGVGMWRSKKLKTIYKIDELEEIILRPHLMFKIFSIFPYKVASIFSAFSSGRELFGDEAISLHNIVNEKLIVFPLITKVRNHGHDGSGVHCKFEEGDLFKDQPIDLGSVFSFNELVTCDFIYRQEMKYYFSISLKSLIYFVFTYSIFYLKNWFCEIFKKS